MSRQKNPPRQKCDDEHAERVFKIAIEYIIASRNLRTAKSMDEMAQILMPCKLMQAFSAELVLKAFCGLTGGSFLQTHDWLLLHDDLSENNQLFLQNVWERKRENVIWNQIPGFVVEPIREKLNKGSDFYFRLRYRFEAINVSDIYDRAEFQLDDIPATLVQALIEKKPEWEHHLEVANR